MENKKTALELILDLQDAGITNEYVNKILRQVNEENLRAYEKGHNKALNSVYDKFKGSLNFNTQYLKDWLTRIYFK